MRIRLLTLAKQDLKSGFKFYENQNPNLGKYFLSSLQTDIDSLRVFAGIHPKYLGNYYRLLSKRFPYAIYYQIDNSVVYVHAILDCRSHPEKIKKRKNLIKSQQII